LFVKSLVIDRVLTYSEYAPPQAGVPAPSALLKILEMFPKPFTMSGWRTDHGKSRDRIRSSQPRRSHNPALSLRRKAADGRLIRVEADLVV